MAAYSSIPGTAESETAYSLQGSKMPSTPQLCKNVILNKYSSTYLWNR